MKDSKWLKWGAAVSLAGATAVLLDALFLEKYFFETNTYRIGSKTGQKQLRLLLLTDLHLKQRLWPYYGRLARKVNSLKPHLILIAGDTLDGHTKSRVVDQFLGELQQNIPKLAILGNHDHKDRLSNAALASLYAAHNCRLLINETAVLELAGERVVVTGLDDFIESESCFVEAVANTGWEAHHFLLIHSPLQQEPVRQRLEAINQQRPAQRKLNISYIFAGHNHGGQVRFFSLVPKLPLKSGKYVNGWYNRTKPYLYLSKGFGTSTLPFRFGARAELAMFHYYVD